LKQDSKVEEDEVCKGFEQYFTELNDKA